MCARFALLRISNRSSQRDQKARTSNLYFPGPGPSIKSCMYTSSSESVQFLTTSSYAKNIFRELEHPVLKQTSNPESAECVKQLLWGFCGRFGGECSFWYFSILVVNIVFVMVFFQISPKYEKTLLYYDTSKTLARDGKSLHVILIGNWTHFTHWYLFHPIWVSRTQTFNFCKLYVCFLCTFLLMHFVALIASSVQACPPG